MTAPVLLIDRRTISNLMRPADYLEAVETGFGSHARGQAETPPPMHIHGVDGGFHAKGAALGGDVPYAALKLNGNFPHNPKRNNLPTIQGAILLCDATNGALLAILDSIEITVRRTAAATALAARYLATSGAGCLAICGCGGQALAQAEAIADVRPINSIAVWDIDQKSASEFATRSSDLLRLPCNVAPSLEAATRDADIIVTCTTATAPFLEPAHVKAGAFIAAVGADSPSKSEITPGLMGRARVFVDVLDQCLAMGDLRHAVAAGAMRADDVVAELGAVVTGAHPGRASASDIIVFDSTGAAFQDAASAALAYERARSAGAGSAVQLG
jgi:ornithine cyclodeaminase/alanine dehydrogenase-like protein (mu-crystallin family)